MPSELTNKFLSNLEHHCLQKQFQSGVDFANMLDKHRTIFEGILRSEGCFDSSDGNEIMKKLVSLDLPLSLKKDLSRMIRARSDLITNISMPKVKSSMQTCNRIEHLLTVKFWDIANDVHTSYYDLVLQMKSICWNLGLTNPNGMTSVYVTSIILMCKVDGL